MNRRGFFKGLVGALAAPLALLGCKGEGEGESEPNKPELHAYFSETMDYTQSTVRSNDFKINYYCFNRDTRRYEKIADQPYSEAFGNYQFMDIERARHG
jgi:hypothetical protein